VIIQLANLHLNLIETDIQRLVTPFGEINSIQVVRDKLNNRSRGKALVDMPVKNEAENAIVGLHGTVVSGKSLVVTAAAAEDEQTNSILST
jgi:RNA recognition motif-containing protein